jgi:hypothetical protein
MEPWAGYDAELPYFVGGGTDLLEPKWPLPPSGEIRNIFDQLGESE